MDITEIWTEKASFGQTQIKTLAALPLQDGEIRVKLDFAGLTANNVSYAFSGNTIGYWGYFPTGDDAWGKVPVWGYGEVVESNTDSVPVGDRLYGFWPTASHVTLAPVGVKADRLIDGAAHRQALPPLYNAYFRTAGEPDMLRDLETERALYFPLFITSYLLADYLIDNDHFGATQVLVSSVSSKTGFGLAHMLKSQLQQAAAGGTVKVVGLTSPRNVGFVDALGCCDEIITYGQEAEAIDASQKAAFVDMTGSAALTRTLHGHMGENMVCSLRVGATHWDDAKRVGDVPGAEPTFFFAPTQVAKRDEEWGKGVVVQKAMLAAASAAKVMQSSMTLETVTGAADIADVWHRLVAGKVDPKTGLLIRF